MLKLRKYDWIFILIAGILSLLIIFIPMTVLRDGGGDSFSVWIFGLFLEFENFRPDGAGFFPTPFCIIGALFALTFLILGILLLVSALQSKNGKENKLKQKQLFGIGFFYLFVPLIFRTVMFIVSLIIGDSELVIYLGLSFYTIELFMPVSAFFLLLSGALKLSR